MKNIFTLLFAILFTTAVSAQTETSEKINYGNQITHGTMIFTGLFNVDQSKSEYDNRTINTNDFTFDLSGEYAFNRRFSAGLGLGYNVNKYKYEDDTDKSETTSNQFSISPKFTTYGNVHFGWLQPSASVAVPIAFGQDGNEDSKYTSYGVAILGGLNVYLSRKIALYASLGILSYNSRSYKDSDNLTSNFKFKLNPSQIGFGLRYLVGTE